MEKAVVSESSSDEEDFETTENFYLRSMTSLMRKPRIGITRSVHSFYLKTYSNCFSGSDVVDWLVKNNIAELRIDGEKIGNQLFNLDFIAHVTDSEKNLIDSTEKIYLFPTTDHGDLPFASIEELDFRKIVLALKQNVVIKSRKWLFKNYKNCWKGASSVSFLSQHYQIRREFGVKIMSQLELQGTFVHVTNSHSFSDSNYFYKWRKEVLAPNKLADIDLNTISSQLFDKATGVEMKTRTWKLGIYPACFVGDEAVDWMVDRYEISRQDAVVLGEKLRTAEMIKHVVKDHPFRDQYLFYKRINNNDDSGVLSNAIDLRSLIGESNSTFLESVNIVIQDKIGSGGSAEVYKGVWTQQDGQETIVQNVAIKKFLKKEDITEKDVNGWVREINLCESLKHQNIVRTYGVSVLENDAVLLMEFVEKGSLFHVLKSGIELQYSLKLKMACDAARGINYLHTLDPPVMHFDLKSLNILVDSDWTLKIIDFGESRKLELGEQLQTESLLKATIHWTAPEVIRSRIYTDKADIYSLGMVMYEIFVQKVPFYGTPKWELPRQIVEDKRRPFIPDNIPEDYLKIIKACWSDDASRRPNSEQVLSEITKIKEDYEEN